MAHKPRLLIEAFPDVSRRVRYVREVHRIPSIPQAQLAKLRRVAQRYAFRANDYYLGLIDWTDPRDPIRRLIIPSPEELSDWGQLDASNEAAITVSHGVQHKYEDTVLLLCTEVCGGYCRYCFRKRLFMNDSEEVGKDLSAGIRYVARHPEVTDVLLTGGDPLVMSTRRLRDIIIRLRAIPHVQIIRIGSKMPAFNPFRILDDPGLQDLLRTYSTPEKRIYLMAHFDHPRELTPEAVAGLARLIDCGVICANQCPLVKGINDDPAVLGELYRKLSWIGCTPYYLFQGRPTAGNEPFEVPLVRGWEVFLEALMRGSGLAGRPRFVMSHATGKIEMVGVDGEFIYTRYHRAKLPEDRGRFMIFERDDSAYWVDQLHPAAASRAVPGLAARGCNGNGQQLGLRRNRGSAWPHRPGQYASGGSTSEFESGCSQDID
ncbi:MAG: 4Fe-4S cluster-binding domain-containing protein [Planctomycetes bacterium]|nr:4Fe-4S cluster-binding domain-containing protein [Planctomycetota bacterium]